MTTLTRCVKIVMGLVALTLSVRGGPQLQQIMTNGLTAKRFNIVFLSEGYTDDQLPQFPADALEVLNAVLNVRPYSEYKTYFNAFTISVASAEGGSDHPSRGIFRDTYFNSSFDSYSLERLVTIPPNDHDPNYDNGQGKVDALLEALMPEYDIAVLLINDPEYGGSGGITPMTSRDIQSSEILIHELGHAIGGLGDEYALPFPGYPEVEEPNTTTQTNRSKIKWHAWIQPETPVPTSDSDTEDVGLFEGAHYHPTGWYRPKFGCKMRNLRYDLCEVCVETLVRSIYRQLRPIENFEPATTNVLVQPSSLMRFQIQTLTPVGHSLLIRWFTNGVPVPGAVSNSFSLIGSSFNLGTHEVRVAVTDHTPLVRSDPEHLLADFISWKVMVDPEPLLLTLRTGPDPSAVHFQLTGPARETFIIQNSSDLVSWQNFITNQIGAQPLEFTEMSTSNGKGQFFRAIWMPSTLK